MRKLEKIGLIGDDISKNKCTYEFGLNIKNLDLIIRTANLEYDPKDIEEFRPQIKELLKLKLIRRSTSPHRSVAFIVRNHAEISRGKARIVYNYKSLNNNTEDDAYNLPHKDTILNLIQNKKIFTKFDLKSGYNQIKIKEDRKWTTFTCPEGLFEWNVLSFGLKNEQAIFQRFMDSLFKECSFCLVYIDDILHSR